MNRLTIEAVTVAVSIALAAGATWWLTRPKLIIETPAAEETQADGSKLIERKATDPKAKPAHQIPKGSKVERIDHVTITPQGDDLVPKGGKCKPLSVDLTLVRMPDKTRRVVASSPDGEVAGIDIPVETESQPEARNWAAGVSFDPIKQTPGAWIERDIGRVRIGAEVNQARINIGGPVGIETRVRVGWAF